MKLATPPGFDDIRFQIEVIDMDIPALLGLDVMDHFGLEVDSPHNKLAHRS